MRMDGAKAKLCIASALVVLAAAPLVQFTGSVPGAAAPGSIGVFAWGDNATGELGNGTIGGSSSTPAPVSLPLGVTPIAIAAGGGGGGGDVEPSMLAAYAIGSDGHVYAWGDNSQGGLGDGSTTPSASPVVVSLPSGVTATAITAAQGTGYAIGSNGKLYAWGDNFYGELGNGGTTNISTPVTVSLPSGVTPKQIAGGGGTGYAIGSDGNLYAWGYNANGGLGDNSTTSSSTPVVVLFPTGVT